MNIKQLFRFLLLLLVFSGCSTDSESFETNDEAYDEIQIANLRSANCDFITPLPDVLPTIPVTDVIIVQGYTEAHITQAIQSLTPTKRRIFFPSGTYNIPLYTQPNGRLTARTVLNFHNMSDVEIFGEPGTTFKMNFDNVNPSALANMNARMITITNSSNIYVHGITLRSSFNLANQDGVEGIAKGHSNVYIRNSNNVYIYDLSSLDVPGDAINIGASRNLISSNIFITNVGMNNTNRNGITIGGSGETNNVFITGCTFGPQFRSQQFDMEPLEHSNINNVQLENNLFYKLKPSSNAARQGSISALSIEGNGISCVLIKNNIIKSDIVLARSCSNFVIEGNTEIPSMLIRNNSNNVTVINNSFNIAIAPGFDRDRQQSGIVVAANPLPPGTAPNQVDYAEPSGIYFNSNTVVLDANRTAIDVAFSFRNADVVSAELNNIQFSTSSPSNTGFYTKFTKTSLPQVTLDEMTFDHCNNNYSGITSPAQTVYVDLNSDEDSVLITNCQ